MADENRRAEQELTAADGAAEDDHSRADHAQPLQSARLGRLGKCGGGPGSEAGASFDRIAGGLSRGATG